MRFLIVEKKLNALHKCSLVAPLSLAFRKQDPLYQLTLQNTLERLNCLQKPMHYAQFSLCSGNLGILSTLSSSDVCYLLTSKAALFMLNAEPTLNRLHSLKYTKMYK